MKSKLYNWSAIDIYLEYVNEFITVDRMAEYYNVSVPWLTSRIETGRLICHEQNPLSKLRTK